MNRTIKLSFAALAVFVLTGATIATLNFSRNSTAAQAGAGVAYQCVQDHNVCLKSIPPSAFWSTAAYELELGSCCVELIYCRTWADSVNGREISHLGERVDSVCSEAGLGGASAETRRTELLRALQLSNAGEKSD